MICDNALQCVKSQCITLKQNAICDITSQCITLRLSQLAIRHINFKCATTDCNAFQSVTTHHKTSHLITKCLITPKDITMCHNASTLIAIAMSHHNTLESIALCHNLKHITAISNASQLITTHCKMSSHITT